MSAIKELSLIDDSNFKISLEKVSYIKLDYIENVTGKLEVSLKTKDGYKVIKSDKEELVLEFKREKYFEPESIFKIKVVMNIWYKLDNTHDTKAKKNHLRDEIEKNIDILVAPAASYSSIIISALTSVGMSIPIIDPPFFIKGEK